MEGTYWIKDEEINLHVVICVTWGIQVEQEKGGNKETCCFLCYLKAIQEGLI